MARSEENVRIKKSGKFIPRVTFEVLKDALRRIRKNVYDAVSSAAILRRTSSTMQTSL
jgi:hypothetical protein